MNKGEVFEKNISGEISSIEADIAFANAVIKCADAEEIKLVYTCGGNGREVEVTEEEGRLRIKEKGRPFSLSFKPSEFELTLPKKEYESFSVKLGAGKADVDGLICGAFTASLASGEMNCNVFADNIKTKTASGKCNITNCTDRKAVSVIIESASGTHSVTDFACERFEVVSASGSVTANGISGIGEIHCASGRISLIYSEWNGGLEADVKSGKVEMILPKGSGAQLDLDAHSGSLNSTLEGASSMLKGKCECAIGGANVYNVKARIMSGSMNLSN